MLSKTIQLEAEKVQKIYEHATPDENTESEPKSLNLIEFKQFKIYGQEIKSIELIRNQIASCPAPFEKYFSKKITILSDIPRSKTPEIRFGIEDKFLIQQFRDKNSCLKVIPAQHSVLFKILNPYKNQIFYAEDAYYLLKLMLITHGYFKNSSETREQQILDALELENRIPGISLRMNDIVSQFFDMKDIHTFVTEFELAPQSTQFLQTLKNTVPLKKNIPLLELPALPRENFPANNFGDYHSETGGQARIEIDEISDSEKLKQMLWHNLARDILHNLNEEEKQLILDEMKHLGRSSLYPSDASKTSPEKYFCELLSLYLMGNRLAILIVGLTVNFKKLLTPPERR